MVYKCAIFQKFITRLFRSGQYLLFKVHPTDGSGRQAQDSESLLEIQWYVL